MAHVADNCSTRNVFKTLKLLLHAGAYKFPLKPGHVPASTILMGRGLYEYAEYVLNFPVCLSLEGLCINVLNKHRNIIPYWVPHRLLKTPDEVKKNTEYNTINDIYEKRREIY